MKTILLEMLEMSAEKYEEIVIENYLLWCNLNSCEDVECQKLLANASLFNWWYTLYSQMEDRFVNKNYEFYGKADKSVFRQLHVECMINVREFYSRPLMKSALSHSPVTPQLN